MNKHFVKNKKIIVNFFFLLFMQSANYILPLITLPYLFNTLGAEKFGLLAFSSAIILFLQVFIDYGFNLSGTREVSLHCKNKEKLIEVFSSIMIIKLSILFFTFLFLTLLILSFEKIGNNFLIFYITFGVAIGEALFPKWFFQGMEEMKYIAYTSVAIKVFFTIAIFVFVQEESDYYIVPLLNSIGFVVAGIVSLFLIYKIFNISFQVQKKNIIVKYFKESWNIFLTELMPNLYNNFSMILVGFICNMESVGFYSLATRIIGVFNSLLQIMKTVTFPYLNKDFSRFNTIAKIMTATGFFLSMIILLSSEFIMPYIFGVSAVNSLDYIYILALSPLFASILFVYGTNKLLVLKKDQEFKRITFIFSFFGFISTLIFVPMLGAYGAAITLISTRALMAYLTFVKAQKY